SETSDEPWKLVVSDYQPAIDELTQHLVDFGHRDIGFISGPAKRVASQKRHECFLRALRKHGLELRPECTIEGDFTFEAGLEAGRKLLGLKHRPTAIFSANDEIAFGVMNVADEMGLKIPDDLSLVGFDGSRVSTFVVPSLSTVIRDSNAMARLGTQKLLALIEEGPEAARTYKSVVTPRFVPRESTGPVPSGR
ncbi:MAG: substrate-binding domain-containing protein, partial [Lysobacterales bacterium]